MAIDTSTPTGKVRLLINDTDTDNQAEGLVFSDSEISAFLALEGDRVKRAAALALETIATNEALASKVLRSQDVQTDGAKVSDALLARAKRLREQDQQDAEDESDDAFLLAPFSPYGDCPPELTERRLDWPLTQW